MRKMIAGFVVAGILFVTGMPAWAWDIGGNTTNNTYNTTNNQGGQGGTGIGVGVGIGGGANVSNHNSNTNYNANTQGQSQHQGQAQGQIQGQGQNNQQQIAPSQSVKVDAPLIPGVAVAPGLAAGGSQVCLGSFSVGLSGPMAGVAFGKTVQDKGCEKRQLYIILYNTGDARAKAVLDSLYEDAMGKPEAAAKTAAVEPVSSATSMETISHPTNTFQGGE
jgi:hypothetical protein